jgi:hypothetical protein
MAKVQKKLREADAAVEAAQRRGRAVTRKLRDVETPDRPLLPEEDAANPPSP